MSTTISPMPPARITSYNVCYTKLLRTLACYRSRGPIHSVEQSPDRTLGGSMEAGDRIIELLEGIRETQKQQLALSERIAADAKEWQDTSYNFV